MKIDVEKLDKLTAEADKIFLSPDGEQVLLQLLEIENQVKAALQVAKEKLEETALRISPDFKCIQGDTIKVYYRSFGSRFYIDDSKIGLIGDKFYKTKTTYSPETKEIENYIKANNMLPDGIYEAERPKKITFATKTAKDGEDD